MTLTYQPNERVIVGNDENAERAIVIEQSSDHGWINCRFPDRERFASGGWVDPKDVHKWPNPAPLAAMRNAEF